MAPGRAWTRRDILLRLGQATVGCTLAGVGGLTYAHKIEPGWLDVTEQTLRLPRLPDAFAGFRIAQISDLHFGRYMTPQTIAPTIQTLLDHQPDLIVITGDLVTNIHGGEPEMIVEALKPLRAPEGVFAVLGNHDWWAGNWVVTRALRQAGIEVLQNRHVSVRSDGQKLYLAGVDDVWAGQHNLARTLSGLSAGDATILLAHEPDFADQVAADGRALLQLSGHSHGGQVCVPGIGGLHFPPWARKYPSGLYQIGDLALYTNRGLGTVSLPLRFWCRPELTLFTLQPA